MAEVNEFVACKSQNVVDRVYSCAADKVALCVL